MALLDSKEKIMGTYHIADNNDMYEPARTNNFMLLIDDLNDLVAAGVAKDTATTDDTFTNAQEVIAISVVSSSVPHFELGQIDIKEGNNTIHFAGVPTFNNQTIKLNDYIGARTKDILMAWQNLAYDVVSQKINFADKYKKKCKLVEYSPDYEKVIHVTDIYGAWIRNISEGDFDNENNGKREITAEIVYDRAIPRKDGDVTSF